MTAFVHLRAHSEYSLVDGLLRIKSFVAGVGAAQCPLSRSLTNPMCLVF